MKEMEMYCFQVPVFHPVEDSGLDCMGHYR